MLTTNRHLNLIALLSYPEINIDNFSKFLGQQGDNNESEAKRVTIQEIKVNTVQTRLHAMSARNVAARRQYLQQMCTFSLADSVLDEDLERKSVKLVVQLNGHI